MKRRRVPVSRLADFAADPQGFEARRGGPRSKSAAQAGIRFHDQLGRKRRLVPLVIFVLLMVSLLAVLIGVLL